MAVKLPLPPARYEQGQMRETLRQVEQALSKAHSREGDIEVGDQRAVILTSPNGTRYRLSVSDAGALVVSAV